MAANIEVEIRKALGGPNIPGSERTFLEAQLADFEAFDAGVAQTQTAESVTPVTRKFSKGTLKDLQRNKAIVYDPFNTSLARLVVANRPFWYITNRNDKRFMDILSRDSQIAILPKRNKFYVPGSNNLSLDGQKRRLREDLEEEIMRRMYIGGVDMIIGDVATHTGLVFSHFDRTRGRVRLHGADYGYKYARTETPTVGSHVADVGAFDEVHGLNVGDWPHDDDRGDVWALRLVVPAQE